MKAKKRNTKMTRGGGSSFPGREEGCGKNVGTIRRRGRTNNEKTREPLEGSENRPPMWMYESKTKSGRTAVHRKKKETGGDTTNALKWITR